ncbi:hypothetical protein XENORESO_010401 [Xenotaenia resolanae]|uniref:Uncharacterized protein n=1 Tax=Xenotaenia resolanae TaxID=208358 RepID=A0ABV0WLS6_9TELE
MLNQALSVPLLPGATHLLSLLLCLPRQRERLPGCSTRSSGSLTVVTLDRVRSRRPSLNLSADGILVEISKCVQVCRGWHGAADKRARPRSVGPVMDFSCDETGKGPPVQMHSLREFEQVRNIFMELLKKDLE